MTTKYKISLFSLAFFTLMGSQSCKKFLDVNTSPNTLPYDKATMELVLPTAQHTIAYVVGNKYQEIGGFLSQYWTQLPSATQYYDYDRYSFDAIDGDREWLQIYAGALQDLQFVEQQAITLKDSNYNAVSKVLMAYAFQLVSDVHGNVPFTQALKAKEGILNPKFDEQSVVYAGVLNKINEALALMNNSQTSKLGTADVIFGGDMSKWWKFANSLKLRVALRHSEVDPSAAQTVIAGMSTNAADYLASNQNAQVSYVDAQGNKNPLYASIQGIGVDNNVGSKTIIDSFRAYGDLREEFYFDGGPGTRQGAAAAGGYPANSPVAHLGTGVLGATVPVLLLSGHESYFLLAEAKARLWMPGGDAKDFYQKAVLSSFASTAADTAGMGLFAGTYDWPTTLPDQLKAIALQKWFAMCGTQNMEAWSEIRRLNYPVLKASLATQLGNTTDLPARIPYPSNEETANSSFPGQKPITDKMWWDL